MEGKFKYLSGRQSFLIEYEGPSDKSEEEEFEEDDLIDAINEIYINNASYTQGVNPEFNIDGARYITSISKIPDRKAFTQELANRLTQYAITNVLPANYTVYPNKRFQYIKNPTRYTCGKFYGAILDTGASVISTIRVG